MPNILLDFEDLHAGDVVNGQYSTDGVTITSINSNGSIDHHNPPMVFDTANPTGGDHDLATSNMGNVLIFSEDGYDGSDPDDNVSGGIFNFDFDEPTEVLNFRVLDIEEAGQVRLYDEHDNLIKTIHISPTGNNGQATVHINTDDVARMEVELNGSGAIDGVCFCTPEPEDDLDGIVEGTNAGELIDAAYDGDPDGDMVDANDAVAGIGSGDEDIIDAFGGDDTILAGADDDQVFAGSGDDYVEGGAGNDVIYGDSNYSGPGEGVSVRESLNWSQQGVGNGHDLNNFTQNTGSVDVTFTVLSEQGGADTEFESDDQLISQIDSGEETINDNSSLYSVTNGDHGSAKYNVAFSNAVENVSFRINDVDGDGFVRVRAFDENGNQIPLTLSGGSHVSINSGNGTISSNGGYAPDTSTAYSALVDIAGPVARIEIFHDQRGSDNSGINVTDIFFDAPIIDDGEDGNDHLEGGAGDDTIFGEGGNDRLEGQAGNDTLDGGDGNDIILGGGGNDVAEGGAGNDEIWMGSGNDVVNAGDGDDWVHGQSGNDVLNGEDGDDMLFGEDGDDTLTGGAGADMIKGGNDRDLIIGGNDGDNVDGGSGGHDYDRLDLSGEGPFRVVNETVDPDGNSTSGTVEFLDDDGNVTGSLQFAEIEKIIGDRVNQGPTANEDTATTDEDESVTIDVLGNDTDPENDDLTVISASSDDGEVTINPDGTLTFTPAQDFNGDTTITYEIEDEAGNTSTGMVNISVAPVNDDPVAVDDTATTDEDTPVVIDLIGNDTDVDGNPLTLGSVSVPADQGTVVDNGDGTVTFTPAPDFNGEATITYTVEDGQGGEDTGIATVTVDAVNDAPIVCPDLYFVTEDEGAGDMDGNVITNPSDNNAGLDVDPDGDTLTVVAVNGVGGNVGTQVVGSNGGVFTLNPNGSFDFSANGEFESLAPGETQDTVIEYTVSDGNGGTGTATLTITVQGINDGPDAVDDSDTTDEDTPITVDLLANDTDPENDTLTVTSATVPSDQGTLVDNGDGTVTFTPAPNFNGTATISYEISDGNGGKDAAEHVINVTPVNDDPVAVDDTATTDEDEPVTIDLIGNDTDVDGDPLSIGSVSVPADQGTVVDNGDGTVTFTPAPNFNGEATITYTVQDGQGGEDEGEAVVNVGSVNDGPDAVDDSDTTDEDTPITVDLLANDTDDDGDALTVTSATVPADQGTLVDNGDGTVTFTPAPNFNGTATISYEISDGNGGTDAAEHVIEVTPVNDAPDAVNDTDTTDEDTPITLDVLANDTDVDGDTLTVTGATVPAEQGTVEIVDNKVIFLPAANFNGLATISYAIEDGNGGTDTAIHEVDVLPVNDAPVAVDDIASTQEDTAVVIDLIANDTDVDGDDLTIGTVSVPPEQGTVVDNGDGTVTFTPAPNYTGPATIEYTVVDGNGGEDMGGATVNVFIEGVNDGPDAVDDAVTTDEDTPVTIDALANDTDTEGDDLTITGASVPADQGSVEVVDNELVFTPAPDFNGEATITYAITDGNGGTDTAEVTVTVTPVNDDPVAVDDVETTDEDEPITIDLIENDTDVDGDPLTIGSVSVPAEQGTVVDNGDGTVTFTPAPNFNGPATITYTVVDGQGGEDEGQAVVSVGAVNDGPVANDDNDTTEEDTPITVDLIANDTDDDGDALSVINATVPADQGSLVDNGDGTVTFTPAPNFNGTATISYEISDGNGGTDIAEHVIEVTPVNDDPVAVDDAATTDEEEPVTIDLIGNDTDADGDPLTIGSVSVPADQGTVVDNGDGTVTFTPAPDFNGEATITYTVEDGQGGEDEGQAIVTVVSVNDGPDAVDDSDTTDEDTPITVDLLANDTDPENDTLTVTSATVPADQGTLVDNGDGTVTFTPAPNFNGTATISYEISDGNGGTDAAEHVIEVTPVNDDPVAVDDTVSVDEDESVVISPLDNDTDVDGDTVTIQSIDTQPENGTLTDNGDGTYTYEPDPGYNGPDSFTYTVTDGQGGTDTATVNITVNPVNDGPDAVDDSDVTTILSPVVVDVIGNDTDPENDALSVVGFTQPTEGGTVTDNGDGTLTFTPDGTVDGEITFDYTISDGNGGEDTATVTILIRDGIVEGTAGNDLIDADYLGDPEGDVIDGNDEFLPGEGPNDDIVLAGDGDDTVIAGLGDDEVFGGEGDDDLRGNQGDDVLLGEGGDDTLNGGQGDDVIDGGDGDDTAQGGDGDDTILGGAGNDNLQGNEGDDTIDGGEGDDILWGGAGDDTIIGGLGNDNVMGGSGDDDVDLGEGDDIAQTGSGDDTVLGGDGNDTIETNDGNDTVEGGDGDDVINTSGHAPLPDLGYPGLFPSDPNPNDDIDFVDGGAGDDTIITGDDNDTIIGGAGNDTIDGGLDQDTIDGGDGDDRIVGGEGSDRIDGGAGDDTIYAGIDPDLGLPDNLDIPDEDDLVPNNGMDVVNGGDGNDTIFGADDDDILNGDAGDDFIDGGIDDDTIDGGTGNDTIIGGEGADVQSGGDDRDTFIVDNAEDGVGDVIDGGTGGDDVDTLDLTGAGPLRIINETIDADGDSTSGTVEFLDGVGGNVIGTLDFSEIENIVPCFTPGTSIATPRGEMLVEELQVGDKIITRDNGIQEIRWIGAKRMDGRELQNNPHLQPVLIQKGSLGNGLPERDMLVSPNHRMLVNNDRVSLYFEENEVLVSAKHLVNPTEGVQSINSMGTTYIHFMFDNHEVVLSNGAWTESFQPGDYSLKGIGNAQRNEIFELFPELQGQKGREAYASARLTLKKHEARMLFK